MSEGQLSDSDFTVDVQQRPNFVADQVEDTLDVVLRGVDISLVYDGVFPATNTADGYTPADHVDYRVRETARDSGFAIERYDEVSVSLPGDDSRLATVEFSLRVTPGDDAGDS